jgi:hypothetical protein
MEMKVALPLVFGVLLVVGVAGWYSSTIGFAVAPFAPMTASGLIGLSSGMYMVVLISLLLIIGALFVKVTG